MNSITTTATTYALSRFSYAHQDFSRDHKNLSASMPCDCKGSLVFLDLPCPKKEIERWRERITYISCVFQHATTI